MIHQTEPFKDAFGMTMRYIVIHEGERRYQVKVQYLVLGIWAKPAKANKRPHKTKRGAIRCAVKLANARRALVQQS